MNIEHIDKLEKILTVEINKCKICDIVADHCKFGCPKENDDLLKVEMILKEISITSYKTTYKCLYNEKIYNIDKEQIVKNT